MRGETSALQLEEKALIHSPQAGREWIFFELFHCCSIGCCKQPLHHKTHYVFQIPPLTFIVNTTPTDPPKPVCWTLLVGTQLVFNPFLFLAIMISNPSKTKNGTNRSYHSVSRNTTNSQCRLRTHMFSMSWLNSTPASRHIKISLASSSTHFYLR